VHRKTPSEFHTVDIRGCLLAVTRGDRDAGPLNLQQAIFS
jgi:hypothetical protein